ncbi:MAG: hypothetical protein HY873_14120 [Chloroflexi bacterium]|nr:hypothetical protein [Chloroflexota bacterium]
MKALAISGAFLATLLVACAGESRQLETSVGREYAAELATAIAAEDRAGIVEACSGMEDLAASHRDYVDSVWADGTMTAGESTWSAAALKTLGAGIGFYRGVVAVATLPPGAQQTFEAADKTSEADYRGEIIDLQALANVCDEAQSGSNSSAQGGLRELLGTEGD